MSVSYMQVLCVRGHEDLLKMGDIYNVIAITENGNFLLEGVEVPEGYTSFSKDRFAKFSEFDEVDDVWAEEDFDEEAFWAEQPSEEYAA